MDHPNIAMMLDAGSTESQVSTGMELSADGEIRPLDPETWQQRRNLLHEITDSSNEP